MDIYRILGSGAFDFETVRAIATAYEHALVALDVDPTDPLAEIIARKIMGRAKRGELDHNLLSEAVIEELRSSSLASVTRAGLRPRR
jgi:hypothetical protein